MKQIENFFENTKCGQAIIAVTLCMVTYVMVFIASVL